MAKYRQEKVAREVLRVLSSALFEEAQDPRLLNVTITDVTMSSDLSIASVHWLCPKGADQKDILNGLIAATPYLRGILGEEIELRRVPNIRFYYDDAYEKGLEMDALLAKLRKNGEMGSDEPEAENKPSEAEDAQLARMLGKLKKSED